MDDLAAKAARHMYRSDFPSFVDLAFRILHPRTRLLRHWSIELLGHRLARCFEGTTTNLIINMPPRSLKSVCASVAFPAWVLGRHPHAKIVCVAGHAGLAGDHHESTLRLMSSPKYRALFPHVRFVPLTSEIRLRQGGLRSGFAPTGAVTGRGADFIVLDDPQSTEGATDPKKGARSRDWYDRNIYQRLDDKHEGAIILVTQRLSHDDLSAHLLSRGDWDVLRLPAIAESEERFPEFGDRVIREAGDALHPAREDREQLREALHRIGAEAFMAQYQQAPYPPGPRVRRSVFYVDGSICFGDPAP